MKKKVLTLGIVSLSFLAVSCQQEGTFSDDPHTGKTLRIVSLSGFLTETLYDLGLGDQIIGRDITSVYPEQVSKVPALGHVTKLNVEAILEMNPDYILAEKEEMEKSTSLGQLKNAGISIIGVESSLYFDNALKASKTLDSHFDIGKTKIEELEARIRQDSLKLVETLSKFEDKPRVLFIYARGAGRLLVGGTHTGAAAIIEKAGGVNALQSFEDYIALMPESLVEAQPDVILMFKSGLASLDGKEGLSQIPGITETPAYKNDRVIAMDGHYLISFSSRVGQAANELAQLIHQK